MIRMCALVNLETHGQTRKITQTRGDQVPFFVAGDYEKAAEEGVDYENDIMLAVWKGTLGNRC